MAVSSVLYPKVYPLNTAPLIQGLARVDYLSDSARSFSVAVLSICFMRIGFCDVQMSGRAYSTLRHGIKNAQGIEYLNAHLINKSPLKTSFKTSKIGSQWVSTVAKSNIWMIFFGIHKVSSILYGPRLFARLAGMKLLNQTVFWTCSSAGVFLTCLFPSKAAGQSKCCSICRALPGRQTSGVSHIMYIIIVCILSAAGML